MRNGNKINSTFDFKKSVYSIPSEDAELKLIHYTGDEKVYVPQPHGNSKKSRPFTRSAPSFLSEISKRMSTSQDSPLNIYSDVNRDIHARRMDSIENREKVLKCRNVRQVINSRAILYIKS